MNEDRFALLQGALDAMDTRRSWVAFADDPVQHPYAPGGAGEGERAFQSLLGGRAPLDQSGSWTVQRDEVSPYTRSCLEIRYPRAPIEELVEGAIAGARSWARADVTTRVGLCLEILHRLYLRNFELRTASMHTTGQGERMAFTGNGTNALDRGLEALAQAYRAMTRVAPTATWQRSFGAAASTLVKTYRLVPRGVAVAIACASFPAWNTYPAIMANLATGNPVIVKPHPSSVIMLAIAVQTCREVLAGAGFDPNLVSLAVDDAEAPIAVALVEDPRCAIVDFTGGPRFGQWLEHNLPGKQVFTETAGVNPVVIDSVTDLPAAARAIAGGLCLFSAQMCTSPQNVYLPRAGVPTGDGHASHEEVLAALVAAVDAVATVPKRAAALMGAIQAESTVAIQGTIRERLAGTGTVLRAGAPYEHPDFPGARTLTPLIASIAAGDELGAAEQFGPNAFVIATADSDDSLRRAAAVARAGGAISSYLYSTDDVFIEAAEDALVEAGANLTVNAVGPMPMNFSAAYSDYHVSGLNSAGNATLTDESFVAGRFRVGQSRRQV